MPYKNGVPRYVTALEGLTRRPLPPDVAPDDWELTFLDIETTGLVPGYHEPFDIGFVSTDLSGEELHREEIGLAIDHPERVAPGASQVMGKLAEDLSGIGPPPAEAAQRVVSYFQERSANHLIIAMNPWFDIAFLNDLLHRHAQRDFRELASYHVLDLSSMAWGAGASSLFGSALSKTLGIDPEPSPHTAIGGALQNQRIYQEILRRQSS